MNEYHNLRTAVEIPLLFYKIFDMFNKPKIMCLILAFVVLPHRKWVLETGRQYEILIELYDKDSHRIHPSDVRFHMYEHGY